MYLTTRQTNANSLTLEDAQNIYNAAVALVCDAPYLNDEDALSDKAHAFLALADSIVMYGVLNPRW
jgi:hypothetical protein